jgi:hypothetical protein
MTTKHTPGPWKTSCKAIQCESLNKYGNWILATCEREGNEEEDAANLRLMAAAPDLLDALQRLTDWAREHTSPIDNNSPHQLLINAVLVIQKATGEA